MKNMFNTFVRNEDPTITREPSTSPCMTLLKVTEPVPVSIE